MTTSLSRVSEVASVEYLLLRAATEYLRIFRPVRLAFMEVAVKDIERPNLNDGHVPVELL